MYIILFQCQRYVELVLSSELLFCEDSNILQSLFIYKKQKSNIIKNIIIYTVLPVVSGAIIGKYNTASSKFISCMLLVPTVREVHNTVSKYLRKRKIEKCIYFLKLFTNTTKVCINLFHEYVVTLNYYTTTKQTSFHLVINKFASLVLKTIYNISIYLQRECVKIKDLISINEDIVDIEDVEEPPLYVDTDYNSMKVYKISSYF